MSGALAMGVVLALAALFAPVGLAWRWRLGLALLSLAASLGLGALWPRPAPLEGELALPTDRSEGGGEWASSRSCRACHPDAYASWHRTYHRSMTQVASPEAVVATWEGELEHGGRRYELIRRGDRFYVDMPAPGSTGERVADRRQLPVVMTTGSHHMQLYWLPLPWVGEEDLAGAAGLFEEHCASCHSEEPGPPVPWRVRTEAAGMQLHETLQVVPRSLIGAGRSPAEIEAVLAEPQHKDLHAPLSTAARGRIARYVQRLQVPDRMQQFPFAWWIREQRWVHEELTFLQPPAPPPEVEHWEQTWSDACDQCHSVGPQSRYDARRGQLESSVAELGIACEACHGPARAHAERYRDPLRRYRARLTGVAGEEIVHPGELDPERATAICARCHAELARHDPKGPGLVVGERLQSWAHLVQLQEPPYPEWLQAVVEEDPLLLSSAFWPDGTMRVAGRDANAMVRSGCYTRGSLSCLSCHQLHGGSRDDQLRPGARGDAICADCHPEQEEAGSAHSHHRPESEGSRCMNCHMPHTTLGLLGAMRSHRIDSPSATRARQTGRPDACTLCHIDRSVSWAARAMQEWYGHEVPEVAGDVRAAVVNGLLRGDAAQRAVWAWHLGWEPARRSAGGDWQPALLAQALDDPYAAVRSIAGQSLRSLPGYASVDYDFTAPPEQRRAAAAEVMRRWRVRGGAAPRPELLLGPEGLDLEQVELLQTLRDDSPVIVSE